MRSIACLIALFVTVECSRAGVVFTDRTEFMAALSNPLAASESFGGFAPGIISNPFAIAGGTMEISNANARIGSAASSGGGGSSSQAFIAGGGSVGITGPDGDPLGVGAIGFDFANPLDEITWFFSNSGGVDESVPFAAGSPAVDKFVGWIAGPNEILSSVSVVSDALVVDNILADAIPNPEASTVISWCFMGLTGLGIARLRKRKR